MVNTFDNTTKMADEKIDHVERSSSLPAPTGPDGDKAAAVINESGHSVALTYENNKKVLFKIDTRILPVILGIYFLQALDKVFWLLSNAE